MKNIKYLLIGIIKFCVFALLLPVLIPLMVIDILMWLGGADPFETPIHRMIGRLQDRFSRD